MNSYMQDHQSEKINSMPHYIFIFTFLCIAVNDGYVGQRYFCKAALDLTSCPRADNSSITFFMVK